ncbi:MAG: DUF6067 family protein [Candidatus Omnitrophica bacterium]|nr:DUF6067 family protein [Candidatus Omnitrophota bacterium]
MKTRVIMFVICIIAAAVFCRSAAALDSGDLLFYVSFKHGLKAEFARGSATPAKMPSDVSRRIVKGVIKKGWLFGGKNSGIDYYSGNKGGRACKEMYGQKANIFGDSGTVAFWLKPLPNTNNMEEHFFEMWPIHVVRDAYGGYQYNYNKKSGYLYDGSVEPNHWIFLALTWRKGEARAYFNGRLSGISTGTGVLSITPEKFEIALQGLTWMPFQTKKFEDDVVISEFQIFRRPLTGEEIRSLFERGHVTTSQQLGNMPNAFVNKPQRAFVPAVVAAPLLPAQDSSTSGFPNLTDMPAQGCFIERRVGVLDKDPTLVRFACDTKNLYISFVCPVDKSIQKYPVWYPTGEFLAGVLTRDGNVASDDNIEFMFHSKDGHIYQYLLNAKGVLYDSKDGNKSWNSAGRFYARSDFNAWTGECTIPLSELGAVPGDIIDFNVLRSWKLFSSSQNALCTDPQSHPDWGKLLLGSPACASIESAGKPQNGNIDLHGSISGPAGEYTVSVLGKGYGHKFNLEQKVKIWSAPINFKLMRKLEKPGDMALAVEIKNPAGSVLLARTIPFVFVPSVTVNLADYPGWGKLDVTVTPMSRTGVSAEVSLIKNGSTAAIQKISEFKNPAVTIRFNTKNLSIGQYTVVVRLFKDGRQIDEYSRPYKKEPLPAWYHNTIGITAAVPKPWINMQTSGSHIFCLLKETSFNHTLFPSSIVSNGQPLLAGPVRLLVKTAAGKRVITAASSFRIIGRTRRSVSWISTGQDGNLSVRVNGRVSFDGFTWMKITFAGETVEHLTIEIPLNRKTSEMTSIDGPALVTNRQWKTVYAGYWFGNEKAGFEYWWQDQRGWVTNGEQVTITASPKEVTIDLPVIQKTTNLQKSRTITFGWTSTPYKPIRKDWRTIMLYRGVNYYAGDWTFAMPNYPKPTLPPEQYKQMAEDMKKPYFPIQLWYAFGPYMWVGSPEYAKWWREWQFTPSQLTPPDPNSKDWGPASAASSASDLFIWMLNRFVKKYPLRGLYFDCTAMPLDANEAHGCGYIDKHGVRQPTGTLLATRRHYERIYNVIKTAHPKYGWIRDDYGMGGPIDPFFDEIWMGEGLISAIGSFPEKNYYHVVNIPKARYWFNKERTGYFTAWLTELACLAGTDREKRAEWYGKMIVPPKNGKHGVWILPRWKDYEHVAGLGIIHDAWIIGGNDLELPWMWLNEIYRMMEWDNSVRFLGYWENGNVLKMKGGIPEKIVCSLYWRPTGLPKPKVPVIPQNIRAVDFENFSVTGATKKYLLDAGTSPNGWIMLAPMNNTDHDVTVTISLNTRKLGFKGMENGRLVDVFRSFGFTWYGAPGWYANNGDPEPPVITVPGKPVSFPLVNGTVTVTIPKRSFRAMLLEPAE